MRNISTMNHLSALSSYFRFMKVRYAGRTHHFQTLSG